MRDEKNAYNKTKHIISQSISPPVCLAVHMHKCMSILLPLPAVPLLTQESNCVS